jgi:hypothetical protein
LSVLLIVCLYVDILSVLLIVCLFVDHHIVCPSNCLSFFVDILFVVLIFCFFLFIFILSLLLTFCLFLCTYCLSFSIFVFLCWHIVCPSNCLSFYVDILSVLLIVCHNTNPTGNEGELRCSGGVRRSCSTSDTRRVTAKRQERQLMWKCSHFSNDISIIMATSYGESKSTNSYNKLANEIPALGIYLEILTPAIGTKSIACVCNVRFKVRSRRR